MIIYCAIDIIYSMSPVGIYIEYSFDDVSGKYVYRHVSTTPYPSTSTSEP